MVSDDWSAWLRLTATSGIGPAYARRLLRTFGSPEAIFSASFSAIAAVVGQRLAESLLTPSQACTDLLDVTGSWLSADARRYFVPLGDPRYPSALLQTEDPPLVLYVQGQVTALQAPRMLAMVGSRNPTPQGLANAHAFARSLGEAGVCVVSGLALGIDGAAHEGALSGAGMTVAVVGTGLDRVYPKRHLSLAHRIAEHGALVSEFPIGTPPLAPHFPQRNRIIAGLTQGTLVVEAALKSGSLITTDHALQMGREVFAIPGSIHAPQSKGCHALIRQGAKLVESAQDVLEELRWHASEPAVSIETRPSETLETRESALLQALGYDPCSLDRLQARTGLDTATLQVQLLELELSGEVSRLPGGQFQRCVTA
jgi:DNA processing protein